MNDLAQKRFQMVAEQSYSWFRVAEELLGSARVIWESHIEPACVDFERASAAAFPHMRGFYLLAGFSAENFIMGVRVARMRVANEPIVTVGDTKKRKGKLGIPGLTKHPHKLVKPALLLAGLPLTPEQTQLLTRLEPIVKWSGRYAVAREPTLDDGLDHINADDLRTFEGFAQLCRDTWREATSKTLPGGGRIWTERYEG
jgi:hypothetical protein